MINAEKMACDFFVLFPCSCEKHYESKTFKDGQEFLKFVEEAAVHFRTENVTQKFPLVAGIARGNKLDCKYVYSFSENKPGEKPKKMKWVGEGTVHWLKNSMKEDETTIFFILEKDVKIVRSKDVDRFLCRCSEIVNAPA